MANALRREAMVPVEQVIHDLETAKGRPDAALRNALPHAAEITPLVIELVEKAADGVFLIPRQENLLFWGVHILAAARCAELYRPLLRLMREQDESRLDELLSDATTETLPRIIISIFDDDAQSLIDACADRRVKGATRWSLMSALARLTFDGAIPRTATVDFLDRFERESLAEPGDLAWTGWEESIILLGLGEMRERVHATWEDGRNPQREVDRRSWDQELTVACALAPSDAGLFVKYRYVPIDDPVEALNLFNSEEAVRERERDREDGPFGPDPAAVLSLNDEEIDWLERFLGSEKVPAATMSLEMIDGFLCALIAGPGNVRPSESFSAIWNVDNPGAGSQPAYDSMEQAEYVTSLLVRHWNTIVHRLERDYPHPAVLERTPHVPEAAAWAFGFLRAFAMRLDDWTPRIKELPVSGFIAAVMALIGRKEIAKGKLPAKKREEIVRMIPLAVRSIHHLWRGRHDPFIARAARSPATNKVGRNEPCPCGSGRKYKRCCGAPDKHPVD
jgi:yecA family protein